MDKPRRRVGLKGDGRSCFRGKAGGQTVALQAPVDGAARQLLIDAAPHRFDDVVERQGKAAAQLDDQAFFPLGHRRGQPMRTGRAIDHILTVFPAGYGAAMDAELAGQHAGRGGAFLNIGADARRGGGVGVQFQVHQRALPWAACGTGVVASSGRSPWAATPAGLSRFDSLPPQSRAVTPIFRDKTPAPGARPRCSRPSIASTAASSGNAWQRHRHQEFLRFLNRSRPQCRRQS